MRVSLRSRASIFSELDVISTRQCARREAERLNFRSAKVYRCATAVSELGFNLLFHAYPGGILSMAELEDGVRVGLEVVCEDRGPGIADIGLAMQDGYSTNGGLGGGLPGARRLMDDFWIESRVGVGTRVVARMWRI